MRRVLLTTAALCFVGATACFAVGFVGVARLIIDMPPVKEGMAQVAPLQAWLWCFLALSVVGSVILWFVPDRAERENTHQADAEDGGRTDGGRG